MGQKCERRPGVWLELRLGEIGAEPDKILDYIVSLMNELHASQIGLTVVSYIQRSLRYFVWLDVSWKPS